MFTNVTGCDILLDRTYDLVEKAAVNTGGGTLSEVKLNVERLNKAIEKSGLGDTAIARKAEMSRSMVFYLRKGERNSASAEIVAKLAQALNTTMSYLMGGETEGDEVPMQKLPELVKQIAEIASNMSELRQAEALRLLVTLAEIEREQDKPDAPGLSVDTSANLLEIWKQWRENPDDDRLIQDIEAGLRRLSQKGHWTVPYSPRNQDAHKPIQDH